MTTWFGCIGALLWLNYSQFGGDWMVTIFCLFWASIAFGSMTKWADNVSKPREFTNIDDAIAYLESQRPKDAQG